MPVKFILALMLGLAVSTPLFAADDPADGPADAEASQEDAHGDDHHADDHGGDAHGAHAGGGGGGTNPMVVDPDLAIYTLIVFGLMVALLRFTAWGPIVEGLAAREQGIADNIAAAADKHEEAKSLLAQHEAKLASAAEDVRAMLEEARHDAEATKSQIVADAQAAAEAERQRAIRDVEQARDSAIKQLAEQSANLSIDLAARVIKKDITPERQGEIVGEALSRMANPSSN